MPGAARRDPGARDRRAAVWRDRPLAGHLRGGRAPARQPRPGRRPQANGTTRMSDDFITRLERQLEAAELRELNRAPALRRFVGARRLLSVPLAAAATIAVAALVVVLALPGRGREDELSPGSVHEELSYRVLDDDAEHAAQVLRARFAAAGVPATTVSVPARDRLTISAPAAARAEVTALTRPGVLEIYDYERDGPAESLVPPTTRADAEANAARPERAPRPRSARRGPLVRLLGRPALTNEDLASARCIGGVDERTGEPIVQIEFTRQGQRAFEALTRGIARRAAARFSHPGGALRDRARRSDRRAAAARKPQGDARRPRRFPRRTNQGWPDVAVRAPDRRDPQRLADDPHGQDRRGGRRLSHRPAAVHLRARAPAR